jgi:hypothetical protein
MDSERLTRVPHEYCTLRVPQSQLCVKVPQSQPCVKVIQALKLSLRQYFVKLIQCIKINIFPAYPSPAYFIADKFYSNVNITKKKNAL